MLSDCLTKSVRLHLRNMIAFLKEIMVITALKPFIENFCHHLSTEYRIVIICSLEDEESAHVVSKLHQYRREYPPLPRTTEIASYLKKHFINKVDDSAALVDPEM